MISIEADDSSPCKREIENLTEEQANLFLKLVKLYKEDPNEEPQQMTTGSGKVSAAGLAGVSEAKIITPSTVTSENSS